MISAEALGIKIKKLRNEKNLSQQQLADMMFVTRKAVSNWEAGKRMPDINMLTRLSRALGTDTRVFLDIDDENEPPQFIIVDDEAVILKGFLMLLGRLLPDVQMYGFLDSAEVLPFARGNNVSVAFLDIELCESSGLVLAKQLMEINPQINIIFLTCHSEYTAEAIRMHASGYIMKPPTESDVLNELKHLRYPVKGLNL